MKLKYTMVGLLLAGMLSVVSANANENPVKQAPVASPELSAESAKPVEAKAAGHKGHKKHKKRQNGRRRRR